MSVYTLVEREQLKEFLLNYDLGYLIDFQGINAGIENTNYFVTTNKGEFVLTLFEELKFSELNYFMELMAYVAKHKIPSAYPIADKQNNYLRIFNHKPAALVKRLSGQDVDIPTLSQCYILGSTLANMHNIAPKFTLRRENIRGANWRYTIADKLMPYLSNENQNLLKNELKFQAKYSSYTLPFGVIHADLFRDNALFDGNKLAGIIDFYYACDDFFLYDLAITVNSWCNDENNSLNNKYFHELLKGYTKNRIFNDAEREAWQLILRAAALRFWLSRLKDTHFQRFGEITHLKDPNEFKNILQQRRETIIELP
jgi:homoserine kinase type II